MPPRPSLSCWLSRLHTGFFLPHACQVKNFGRAGRTKYTHLVDQDTTYTAAVSDDPMIQVWRGGRGRDISQVGWLLSVGILPVGGPYI